ncbi:glycosyltransferase [Clostridium paraputrificum]|uniref:glycosyltransferase n=1 Tax=Clostridium paraputrificum TaxID=29363 RepID=UPI003D33EA23
MNSTKVTFIIVAYNSSMYIDKLFEDLKNQDYDKSLIQFILVDSVSTDNTYALMENFKESNKELDVTILRNEKKILSSGWNIALSYATGDVVIRVDAHSELPKDFISANVIEIEKGNYIVGGTRPSLKPKSIWSNILATVERSKFGSGIAPYRHLQEAKHVDTIAHACYSREVFKKVGGYDERLIRTEDNDMHYRMKEAGYKFWFSPTIKSYHYPRFSLKGMLKQKYGNGYWIGATMSIQPNCFSVRHFIPLVFVLGLIFTLGIKFIFGWDMLFNLALGSYSLLALLFTILAIIDYDYDKKPIVGILMFFILPFIFFINHLWYGIGTIVGLFKGPKIKNANKKYKVPYPIK